MPSLNYIWVGKPRTDALDQLGQDVMGPVAMSECTDSTENPVFFWCLAEHKDYYDKLLRGQSIAVRAIETTVSEKIDPTEEGQLASEVLALINRILEKQNRSQIRDFVTVKELFAFLLLATDGDYVMDTNVMPAASHVSFPTHPNFHMPAFVYPVEKHLDADVWMMYSPNNNRDHAKRALRYFLDSVNRIEKEIFDREGYSGNYRDSILHVVIKAALLLDDKQRDIHYWCATRLGSSFPVKVFFDKLGVMKLYFNTHGAQDRDAQSDLLKAVVMGKTAEVAHLLQQPGIDVNAVTNTEYYRNITALSAAHFYGREEIAAVLRSKGAKDFPMRLVRDEGHFSFESVPSLFRPVLPTPVASEQQTSLSCAV